MRTSAVALVLGAILVILVLTQESRAVHKGNTLANLTEAAPRRGRPVVIEQEDTEEYDSEEYDQEEAEEQEEEEEEEKLQHSTPRSKGDKGKKKKGPNRKKIEDGAYKVGSKGGFKMKKLKKYMLPLLIAYKLKFLTIIPLLIGGLVLIVASTGFAGFFFALFAVGIGLKKD